MRKKRILFAAVDVGYRMGHYCDYINSNFEGKLIAESFTKHKLPSSHFDTKYDYHIEIGNTNKYLFYIYIFFFFIYSLFRFDVFHFISGEMILTKKLQHFEFLVYKLFKKKIIMHFVGADIRSMEYLSEKESHLLSIINNEFFYFPTSNKSQIKLISLTRKFASRIIVSTPDLQEIIPEADYLPVFLNFSDIPKPIKKDKKIINILFSPSGIKTKGNSYIYPILERLKFDFGDRINIITPGIGNNDHYTYSTTRKNLLNLMNSSHIVIDQMVIGWYGLKSVEALSLNCKVICYIKNELLPKLPSNCPIINANVLNLEFVVRDLINNFNFDEKIDNLNFIKENHKINQFREYFNNLWLS